MFFFWAIILDSRYAKRSTKGYKDRDARLISKKFWAKKNDLLDWRPGPGKVGQRCKNMPSLWRHQQKTPNPNQIFFKIETGRLAKSVDDLNTFLALATGDLWPKKCRPLKWPGWALKGSSCKALCCLSFICLYMLY